MLSGKTDYLCKCPDGQNVARKHGLRCEIHHDEFCKQVHENKPFDPEPLINHKIGHQKPGYVCMTEAERFALVAVSTVAKIR